MKRALPTAKSGFLATFFCVANLFFASVVFGQTVTLDQADLDYAPGETVYITGTGWQPNEVINLQIHHLTEPIPDHGTPDPHLPWTILADSSGSFDASWYVTDFELGSDLLLVANGVESGFAYEVFFTDGTAQIKSVSLGIISPANNDGIKDNTSIVGENQGGGALTNFGIKIHSTTASGSIVKNLYSIASLAANSDASSQIWNGKDESNVNVPDGVYFAVAGSGNPYTESTDNTRTKQIIIDNTNPTVALNTPIANAVVNGTIDFVASPLDLGGDDSNIDKVEFYLDGGLIGTDSSTNSGWKISYNTAGTSGTTDGAHTWYVKVFDKVGNNVTSGTRAISVLNATSGSIASVGIGTQSGVSVYGAVSTPSYNITSVRGSNGTVNGTYSVTGLPTGVTSSFASSATFTSNGSTLFPGVTLNLNVPASLNAGSYNFTVSLSDGSSTSTAIGTLTVSKASITVVNTSRSKVYGQTLTNTDYSGSITGIVAGDAITVTRASTGGVATATVAGSTYPIVGTLVDPNGRLGNYNVTNTDGALTVTKASITVVNTNRSKVYGQTLTDTDYSGSITGVVADDAITVTRSSTGGVATATVAGSTYPIVGTLVDPNGRLGNYNVTNSDGALTVTKASITVVNTNRSKVYGETLTDTDYSGSITGVVADDAITVTRASTGGVATATVAGSTYPIVGTLVDPNGRLGNYNVTNTDGALTVTKASITVVNTNRSKVYGQTLTDTDYSGSITGVVADDAITVTRSSTGGVATATVASSTYPIVGTLVDPNGRLGNYNVSNSDGALTVTKASITVVNTSRSKVYGETLTDTDYSGSITGVVIDDAITVTRASTGDVATATVAGSTYPIVGTLVDPNGRLGNYNVTNTDGALTVTKASITVVNTNRSKVYGQTLTDADFSGSITGIVAGDAITVTRASTGGVATATVAGSTYPIVGTLVDPDGRLGNYNVTNTDGALTVTKAVLSVTANDKTRQYSDANLVLTVTIEGFVNDDNKDDLTTVPTASTLANASSPVGTYPIIASGGVDDNYSFVYFLGTLTVIQEDACAYYTGALFASTANATSSNATITLAATIKELSDSSAGNITNAKVYFMIDGGQKLGPFTPGIVSTGDNTVGTVVCNWLVDIGNNDSMNYTVRVIVEGYYSGTCGDAQSVVTVSKPLDDFITGGGYLKLTSSSGIKSGDLGSKNNFGFNVKFNKSKTNLQGTINTIVRRTESDGLVHVYQIKGNSMTSLSVQPSSSSTAPIATFNGKANIQDITNPLAPISVEGNATLQVTMVDNGEPGAKSDPMDRISITVWNKSGGLWFASNWNGAKTVDQNIAQGNLKVRSSGSFVSGTALSNTFLASSFVPSTVGQSVAFTATVAGSGTSIPSGTITFIDYSTNTTLAKVSLNKGIATYSTSSLILGVHEIYAYYGGDSKYSSSANSLTQTVNAPLAGRTILATSTKKDVLRLTEPTSFDVKIYPNPAQYQFTLELEGGSSEKTEAVVYDLLGRMVKHIENNDLQPINFGEELPAGTYIVTVRQGENQKTIKLIKQ